MAGFDMDADRWLSHAPLSDDLGAHPIFGSQHHAPSGPLFMDITANARPAATFRATGMVRANSDNDGGYDEGGSRAVTQFIDDDDDGDEVLIARSMAARDRDNMSVSAAPPSQQYTEGQSSQSTFPSQSTLQHYSQESTESMNPTKLRTDEFMGFWAHKLAPRPAGNLPPTPQLQRTFAVTDESPSALVDGIVRAGLDTPFRVQGEGAYARPHGAYLAASEGPSSSANSTMQSSFGAGAHASPANSTGSPGASAVDPGRRQYRTVQQYLSDQQQSQQSQQPTAARPHMRQPAPPAPGSQRHEGPIVVLEFKMERRRRFRCPPEIAPNVKNDLWVVVQLDNGGVDMGCCVEVYASHERMTIPRHYGHGECGVVVRLADDDDCRVLNDVIPAKEETALAKAHQLVHFLHMPFTCIDAEFQFDLKSVNLYYTLTPQAFTSIIPNVSRLQRELGFVLKAKVHLEQLVPVDA